MLSERVKAVSAALLLVDLLAMIVAFVCAYALRNSMFVSRGHADFSQYLRLLAIAAPIFGLVFWYIRGSRLLDVGSMFNELAIVGKACLIAIVIVMFAVFYLKYQFVSRVFLLFFSLLSFAFVSIDRIAARWLMFRLPRHEQKFRNIVVVGTGDRARRISQALEAERHWGLRLIGYIEDDDSGADYGLPVFGGFEGFRKALEEHVVDGVVFALPPERMVKSRDIFTYCCQVGIPIYVYAKPFEDFPGRLRMENIAGIDLIAFRMGPQGEFELLIKRGFDFVFSVLALVIFAPIMFMVAILIKLNSRGPVFFRQVRVGKSGRLFTLYKFRTMIADAEKMKSSLAKLNEMDGPVFKIRKDPRLTKVGQFLRHTSLDEIPQLFNVLVGQMSIVGPRPPLVEEVERYEVWHRRRLSVKPGLTCLWQVSDRYDVDFRTWMGLDLQYIDNWSWALDLSILLRTIPAMLRGR